MSISKAEREKKIKFWAGIGLAVAIGFVVSPFIFMAIGGLIGLAIAAATGATLMALQPWFSTMIANWRLKALKYEVSRNPVETLQNQLYERTAALEKFRNGITEFRARINSFESKVDTFKAQFPNEAEKFERTHKTMQKLLELRTAKYKEVKIQLEAFELEIVKADAIWKMSVAAQELSDHANIENDFMAKLKEDTALESIQMNMSRAFAELENAMMDEDDDVPVSQKSLSNNPSNVIDVETRVKQKTV